MRNLLAGLLLWAPTASAEQAKTAQLKKLDITADILDTGTDADSSATSSDSGLQILSKHLTLLRGCADGEGVVWTESTDKWGCGSVGGGSGDNITVNSTAATNANFLDNLYLDFAIDTAATPDDITGKFNYAETLAGNPALLTTEIIFTADGLLAEGTTADAIEIKLAFPDPATTDKTITLFNATDTVVGRDTTDTLTNKTLAAAGNVLDADTAVALAADPADCGANAFAQSIATSGALTCATPALGTDTSGSYAAGDAEAGAALTGDSATSFFSAGALEVTIGGTGATTLTDGGMLFGSGTGAITALSVATNGQIPIGDSVGDPVLATITGTANEVTVTNGAGTITLDLPLNAGTDITADLEEEVTSGSLADNVITDAELATTESLNLPIYSAKLTGAFVVRTPTSGDASTQGAQIDAGDGNWRLLFDPTTDEAAVWEFRLPDYWAAHSELNIAYTMTSATTLEVEFEADVMCVSDGDAADVGTASFAGVAVGSATVPGTAGFPDEISITLTDDACAAGDMMWLYLSTDANDATNDDATGDREVTGVEYEFTR